MSDNAKKFSVMEEQFTSIREEVGTFPGFEAPPVPMEQLPQGLIEDQV